MKQNSLISAARTRPGYHWALELLIFFAVYFVIAIPEGLIALYVAILEISPESEQLVLLFATVILIVGVLVFCRFLQSRPLASLGFWKAHALTEYLIGIPVGVLLIGLSVALCLATGSLTLKPQSFPIGKWLLFFLGFTVQGMSEEVLCRGYFMLSVMRKNAIGWGILLNALCFSLLHFANPGFTPLAFCNIFLFGILMSLYVMWRESLWGVCAMHSIWNFCQGNVFGISVSGTGSGSSPLSAAQANGKTIWHGGTFGIEGGLAVTIVLLIAILFVTLLYRKKECGENRTERFPPRS